MAKPIKRLVLAGTPNFAAVIFKTLIESQRYQIAAIYTQPDRPKGRGKKMLFSPVKELALHYDIPLLQPESLKTVDAQRQLVALAADLLIVVAYGQILNQAILDTPRYGCLNVHASLLPRWRGAAPIHRAIEAGDTNSGVTIMQMDAGLDTGDMLLSKALTIDDHDNTASLHDRLTELGANALLEALLLIERDAITAVVQDNSEASYAHKITTAEALIDWSESAIVILRKIRAFFPAPCAYSFIDDKRIKIISAQAVDCDYQKLESGTLSPGTIVQTGEFIQVQCGDGFIAIKQLQLPGKSISAAKDILRGYPQLFSTGNTFINSVNTSQ